MGVPGPDYSILRSFPRQPTMHRRRRIGREDAGGRPSSASSQSGTQNFRRSRRFRTSLVSLYRTAGGDILGYARNSLNLSASPESSAAGHNKGLVVVHASGAVSRPRAMKAMTVGRKSSSSAKSGSRERIMPTPRMRAMTMRAAS